MKKVIRLGMFETNSSSTHALSIKVKDPNTPWKTVEEIAVSVGRDKGYIRNKILPQMENVLERMYKDIPNHPGQKYKAKQQKNNLRKKSQNEEDNI
ncbi:MAG: hypothetical protein IK033_07225 [Verrucomicrobia bacterium]|nr:hypothetical protein [Verrucomicrobiota bacterium]